MTDVVVKQRVIYKIVCIYWTIQIYRSLRHGLADTAMAMGPGHPKIN